MQYQVLARKWRPQNFHDLVGQEHVSQTLINALKLGRVAHAFLFAGPRGSGKTSTARILAKALNCHAASPGEPCSLCVACQEIAVGNCMDVLEIDAASNRGIEEIRELRENVRYSPARDRHKIFIIDEVHMLTDPAFNALLKTLEEPPPHVVFIMATTEYHKIPATILSRCQQYRFKLIPFPQILERLEQICLEERITVSRAALEQMAFSSGGSMRDAMSALDQVIAFSGNEIRDEDVTLLLGLVEPRILHDTVAAIAGHDTDRILRAVGSLVEEGQDLQNFCRRLMNHIRNLMVLKSGVADPGILGVPGSMVPTLEQQAKLFSEADLLRIFDALVGVEVELKYATHIRFQLEMGMIKISQIARMRPLEDLIREFQSSGSDNPHGPPRPRSAPPQSSPAQPPSAAKPAAGAQEAEPEPPNGKVQTGTVHDPPAATQPPPEAAGSSDLLARLSSAVKKESLNSILHSVLRAELRDDTIVLDPGAGSEFLRRQILDNLPVLNQAAAKVLGRPASVALAQSEPAPDNVTVNAGGTSAPVSDAVLDRAKRQPVVRSFLDTFPGPVKAEDIIE